MARYTVIESRVWCNADTGARASIYGALPYRGDKGAWQIVTQGWKIRDNREGTVGLGRAPFPTQADAQALADKFNARCAAYS